MLRDVIGCNCGMGPIAEKTGFVWDESVFWHNVGSGGLFLPAGGWVEAYTPSDAPDGKRRTKNLLDRSGFIRELEVINPRSATRAEVELYHTPAYVDKIKTLSETTGGDAGELTPVGKGSYEIALISAGMGLSAIDAVMEGKVHNAYCLNRPVGHHAETARGRGFCIFNNVVIATKYARQKYGLKRIMILDWDVHHGNGTEDAFYSDPNTLFISLHQYNYYPPNRGMIEDVGKDKGRGFNVNIPMLAGGGDAAYVYAMEKIVVPIADQFKPELVLISAGQDPNLFDSLARMQVTPSGFGKFASIAKDIAERNCSGRLVALQEGGYSPAYVPFCTLRIIEALSGLDSGVPNPFAGIPALPTEVSESEKAWIGKNIKVLSEFWDLSPKSKPSKPAPKAG